MSSWSVFSSYDRCTSECSSLCHEYGSTCQYYVSHRVLATQPSPGPTSCSITIYPTAAPDKNQHISKHFHFTKMLLDIFMRRRAPRCELCRTEFHRKLCRTACSKRNLWFSVMAITIVAYKTIYAHFVQRRHGERVEDTTFLNVINSFGYQKTRRIPSADKCTDARVCGRVSVSGQYRLVRTDKMRKMLWILLCASVCYVCTQY